MAIQTAIDISDTLQFSAPNKQIVFSDHIKKLFSDLQHLLAEGKHEKSYEVGKLLASYLKGKTPLASTFNWQQKQDYYDRFILFGSKEYNITLMALIWPENTFSPIHYHQAWCVFGICDGALTEDTYTGETDNQIELESIRHYPRGAWAHDSARDKYYHKLGNGDADAAISLHVYGVSPDNLHKINCVINQP